MKKQPSIPALAARAVRAQMKALGIKGRVRSSGYTGGSIVNVDLMDIPSPLVKKLEAAVEIYSYDKGSRMDDSRIAEHNDDVPQVSFVSIESRYSIAVQGAALDKLKADGVVPMDAKRSGLDRYEINGENYDADVIVYCYLKGSIKGMPDYYSEIN